MLLHNIHNFVTIEAVDDTGAAQLMDGGSVNLSDAIVAALGHRIKFHSYQGVDPNLSLPGPYHKLAHSSHSTEALTQDWEELTQAALSATREVIRDFKHVHGSEEAIKLSLFTQSVTLSTLLSVFFRLPITPTTVEDVIWIVNNTWRTEECWEEHIGNPHNLYRLAKSSPNPSGIFTLLSTIQRLILASICTIEQRGENIEFIRRAGNLLHHPTTPEPDVTRFVEKVKQLHPPIQSIHGTLSLSGLPSLLTCKVGFLVPVDSLPPSACLPGPDGACLSWLHKAALPGSLGCGGDEWLVRVTTIILSAIETEIRNARLTVDGDERDPEDWEEWVLRRLRVG